MTTAQLIAKVLSYQPGFTDPDPEIAGHITSIQARYNELKMANSFEQAALISQSEWVESVIAKAQPINTHVRLFDLVRHQRAELHLAGLIAEEEYAWLSGGSGMANSPKGGSPSPRRLEDYDELRARLNNVEAERDQLATRHAELAAASSKRVIELEREVHESVERAHASGNALYLAIVKRVEPYLQKDSRDIDWDVLPATIGRIGSDLVVAQRLLVHSFRFIGSEIERVPLNESAARGLQSLSREIAQFLDSAQSKDGKTPSP